MLKKIKLIKNAFLKRQKGAVAVEWVITSPVIMLLTFFNIMFAVFCLNFWVVGNSAFEIAQNLNMGDKGYERAASIGGHYSDTIRTNERYGTRANAMGGGQFNMNQKRSQIATLTYTGGNSSTFGKAAKWAVGEVNSRGGFSLPFTWVRSVDVRVYDSSNIERIGFNTYKGETESGDMVVVTIRYTFLKWITFSTRGYSFII